MTGSVVAEGPANSQVRWTVRFLRQFATTEIRLGAFKCMIGINSPRSNMLRHAGLRTVVQIVYGFDSLYPLLIINDLGFRSERFLSDFRQNTFPFSSQLPKLFGGFSASKWSEEWADLKKSRMLR
jgi:hypothetical protein